VIKIKLKRFVSAILVLIMTTTTFVFAGGTVLTMQDAIKTAVDNSVDITKYSNAIQKYEREYRESIVSSRQMKDLLELDDRFRKLSRKGDNRTPQENAEHRALYLMFEDYMSFEERLNLEIASELTPSNMEYLINVHKSLLKSAKDNVYLSVYGSFNKIAKINDSIMIKTSLINNLESNYKIATAKNSLGKLSNNSLKLIGYDLQKSKIELSKLKSEKQKLIFDLNRILGIPLDTTYDNYSNEQSAKEMVAKKPEEYLLLAFTNRDDVKSAQQYYEIKQKEFDITKIYYLMETEVAHMNALVALNDAKNKLDNTKMNVQLQVTNAYNNFQSQLNNLEKSKINRDLNERLLQDTKQKYNLGLTTELELNKANINYSQSQLTYLTTSRDAWLAKLNLDLACGIVVNNN